MKKLIILFITLLFSGSIFCQNMQIEWQQCFGGSETDYAMDMLMLDDGYFILGNTSSDDGDISFNHGLGDIWLIKSDNMGNIVWEKCYGGSSGEGGHRIFEDNENNFYIVGRSGSSDGDISYDPYPNSLDYWIVKIDINGNIIWEKIVGGNGGDHTWTGTATDDGGVVAIGYSLSDNGDVSINYGLFDMWMIKLSSEGEIEWDFTLGTDSQDYGQAIIQTSDGGFLVGGASTLAGGGNLNCENHGESDGVLVKLDADRNIEWQKCYGGSDYDGVVALLEINDGYVFGAYTHSNDGDVSGWNGESDVWIVKIDFFGNIIWQNALGGSNWETTNSIIQTSSGNLISFAVTRSNNGDVFGNHSLSEYDHDIWMIKLNSTGELISQQCIGGEVNEIIDFGVVEKSDNNFVIAGQTNWGPSYDVQCTPHGGNPLYTDFWVFEIKDTTTNINTNSAIQNRINVYPNPAKDYVIFETHATHPTPLQGVEPAHIIIIDLFGREVARKEITSEKTVFDLRQFKEGIYFYRIYPVTSGVEIEDEIYSGKFIVQK